MKYLIVLALMLSGCEWKTEEDRDKVGQVEEITEFAWFPKNCQNNKTYWLQNVNIKRHYHQGPTFIGVYHNDECR